MVLDSVCRVCLIRPETFIECLTRGWAVRHGPLSHRPIIIDLLIFLDGHLLGRGETLPDPGLLLRHSVFVKTLFQEHFLSSEGVLVDDHVVLRALRLLLR